jgi:hypothetical protein
MGSRFTTIVESSTHISLEGSVGRRGRMTSGEGRHHFDPPGRDPHRVPMGDLVTTARRVASPASRAPFRRANLPRACARCGSPFQPTDVRRLTCRTCYLINTDLDPMVWRYGHAWARRPTQDS